MNKRLALVAVLAVVVLLAIAAAYAGILAVAPSPESTSASDDQEDARVESYSWFGHAGLDGAVVCSTHPGRGGTATGVTARGEEVWAAASVFDLAAARPPAALLTISQSPGRLRVRLVEANGRQADVDLVAGGEGADPASIVRNIGVVGQRCWYAVVSPRAAEMKCVAASGRVLSKVSLGDIDDILSAGAAADGTRFALLTESRRGGESLSEIVWVRGDSRGNLSVVGRMSVTGSFMALSSDGRIAMTGEGDNNALVLPFGSTRGTRLEAPFVSDGAICRQRALVVSRRIVGGQPTTHATVIDVASGRTLWDMKTGDQWLVHADPDLHLVAAVDPVSHVCQIVDIGSGRTTRLRGEYLDAWPVSGSRVATLATSGKVTWQSVGSAK